MYNFFSKQDTGSIRKKTQYEGMVSLKIKWQKKVLNNVQEYTNGLVRMNTYLKMPITALSRNLTLLHIGKGKGVMVHTCLLLPVRSISPSHALFRPHNCTQRNSDVFSVVSVNCYFPSGVTTRSRLFYILHGLTSSSQSKLSNLLHKHFQLIISF